MVVAFFATTIQLVTLHYRAHSNDISFILFITHIDAHATTYPYFRTTSTFDKKNRSTKFFLPINFKICSFVLLSKYPKYPIFLGAFNGM